MGDVFLSLRREKGGWGFCTAALRNGVMLRGVMKINFHLQRNFRCKLILARGDEN